MPRKLPKIYEPKQVEGKIYKLWERGNFFSPKKGKGKPFVVTIPPPNITGSLHMGHALNSTIQDVIVRYHRMQQEPTLWIPGTDHAGIATQNVVEKELKKQGLTRQDLGREKFIKRVWQWKEKYGNLILTQLKKLGCSCDWSRTRFTLDKDYVKAVETAFLHYYKKGWIYKGPRIVNWCPRCGTAISDIEVKYVPHKTKLWYIKYPFQNSKFEIQNSKQAQGTKSKILNCIIVATTRPETMLGDTAVAVNPKDIRYKNLVGQKVILPLMNREIPIIADHRVDPAFGTGAVKITPAHDAVDNKIGKIHKLEVINVIGEDGKITEQGGKYKGLLTLEAREKIIEDLKSQNLLEKEEDYEHSLAVCDRCQTPIEPLISKQWFVKMEELARPAIKVVRENKIKFIPERYKKVYLDWMNNIEDWCISRQLWWGHQIPVFYCRKKQESEIKNEKLKIKNSSDELFVVAAKKPDKCPFCKRCSMKQAEDVLDTWFSSALWPFATLGWPLNMTRGKPRKNSDLDKYYPTTLLSTARDIIYLWVARMIFSSLELCRTIPFKNVFIHSTILTVTGKRMSKSLGTGIDPLELIEKYGADATRFGLLYLINRDQQVIKFSEDTTRASKNFCNKLWNINRFINMSMKQNQKSKIKSQKLTSADRWILSRLNAVIQEVTDKIENYQLGEAARQLYDFVWHEYADWYIELSKLKVKSLPCSKTKFPVRGQKSKVDLNPLIFRIILQLLHPFMPFITEYLWRLNYPQERPLIISKWPKADKKFINKKIEAKFEKIKQEIIKARKKNPGIKLQDIPIIKKI